jgi:hypothetical protein
MDRPGTCIILDKKYNIANSSCHFGSYGSIWTGPSPKKYYMDLRSFGPYNIFLVKDRSIYCHMTSFGPYNIFLVTDRSIYCHMTLSAMNYLLYHLSIIQIWVILWDDSYCPLWFNLHIYQNKQKCVM